MSYEPDMSVIYDAVTKKVTVSFRGDLFILDGPFAAQNEGRKAGEALCRTKGWEG